MKIVSDNVFPTVALDHLGTVSAIFFIIGLISAAFPSADGALTALTSVFCIDFLGLKDNELKSEEEKKKIRYRVHFTFAGILLLVIVIFKLINNDSVINNLFTWAGYTYGPLLGLFAFGILTQFKVKSQWIIPICVLSPIISWLLDTYSK